MRRFLDRFPEHASVFVSRASGFPRQPQWTPLFGSVWKRDDDCWRQALIESLPWNSVPQKKLTYRQVDGDTLSKGDGKDIARLSSSKATAKLEQTTTSTMGRQEQFKQPRTASRNVLVNHLLMKLVKGQATAEEKHALANIYENGRGVRVNLNKAYKLYYEAAAEGVAHAQYSVGHCFERGRGTQQNLTQAVHWYTEASENNVKPACYALGRLFEAGKGTEANLQRSIELYRKAADEGHVQSQYSLGFMYEKGKGVERDLKKAEKWYRSAMESGHRDSLYRLSALLAANVSRRDEALQVLDRLCAQDKLEGSFLLSRVYIKKGLQEKNAPTLRKGLELCERVANEGNAKAMHNLAHMYDRGIGVEMNKREAFRWFKRAAESDHCPSQYRLGHCYDQGVGVEPNNAVAIKWIEKAALAGNPKARRTLVEWHADGKYKTREQEKLDQWSQEQNMRLSPRWNPLFESSEELIPTDTKVGQENVNVNKNCCQRQ